MHMEDLCTTHMSLSRHAATAPHNLRTKYNVTLARLRTSSLRMVEDQNM
jgi:hypothetical protein